MERYLPRLFVVVSGCLLIAIGLTVIYIATQSSSPTSADVIPRVADQVKEIAGYRSWSKVNSEPQAMPRITARPALVATVHTAWPAETPTAVAAPPDRPPNSVLRMVRAVSWPGVQITSRETPRKARYWPGRSRRRRTT